MSVLMNIPNKVYVFFEFLAKGIELTTDFVKWIINLNYDLVVTLAYIFSYVYAVVHYCCVIVADFFFGLYVFLFNIVSDIKSSLTLIIIRTTEVSHSFLDFLNQCYMNLTSSVLAFCLFITSMISFVKDGLIGTVSLIFSVFNCFKGAIVYSVMSVFYFVTSIGSFFQNILTNIWYFVGYIVSNIAYFPKYCFQTIEHFWNDFLVGFHKCLTSITKETYLGIVCICLLYLTVSNALRHGLVMKLSNFQRSRSRRSNWHFDPGFESDYEDYGSDMENEELWDSNDNVEHDENTNENDSVSDDTVQDSSSLSSESDDVDDNDSESDELTPDSHSESEESIHSHTFSTNSSEIDVQLPPISERYNLRNRSSTPSRSSRLSENPEDFEIAMERERDKRKCVVCQDQIKSVLVLPCKHMCMCVDCADQIVKSRLHARRVCPLCRVKIQKVMNIYV